MAQLRASSLQKEPQQDLEARWKKLTSRAPASQTAEKLYAGAGVKRLLRLAGRMNAELYVLSAGLGLVKSSTKVPGYDLAAGDGCDQSISLRVADSFDSAAWWTSVSSGKYSEKLADLFLKDGLVLIALTGPYAALIGEALAQLPDANVARLRIFGQGISRALPRKLGPLVMPYDVRLNNLVNGIRGDFAHRALEHFAEVLDRASGDAQEGAAAVKALMESLPTQVAPSRDRIDDHGLNFLAEILSLEMRSPYRALATLRNEWGIACEQWRFFEAFKKACSRWT